jgi:type 1 glutamine amidotransferase
MRKLFLLLLIFSTLSIIHAKPIKVLILSGHTDKYHYWPIKSEYFKAMLATESIFQTEELVLTDSNQYNLPTALKLTDYKAIVINFNELPWNDFSKQALEKYIKNGGGLVVIHEADNAFPEWPAYNEMIGLGGWGGRNEKSGPYYYWKDYKFVIDNKPGTGGSHGQRVPYVVNVRNVNHPITKGLPAKWLHINDELYGNLRGPAKNMEVLATAFSTKETGGTGKEEPVLIVLQYGKGRIFHSVMGHTTAKLSESFENVGFQVTFLRGTEWAATGKVKQKVPVEMPTAEKAVLRNLESLKK